MRIIKITILIFFAALLVGCSGGPLQFIDTAVSSPKLRASDPQPLVMGDVEFIVISLENIDEFLPDIQSGDLVLVSMTAEDYKIMSTNTLMLLNYIKAQKNVLGAYREFYEK